MKKRRKRSLVPWVVDTEHILNWVKNNMPVRYKLEKCYLKEVKFEEVMIFSVKSGKFLHVDMEDITLLI
jgi:hypothetical protein